MSRTISCSAPYGIGGVGQHLAHVVEEAREAGALDRYFATDTSPDDEAGRRVRVRALRGLRYTPFRFSPGWTNYLEGDLFDRAVASRLTSRPREFVGFVGKALHSFRRARALGCERLELVALNTHVRHVQRQHAKARADWPLQRSWMNEAQARKTLAEYEMADTLHVHSDLTWQTFVENGVPERKLQRTFLKAAPRFRPPEALCESDGLVRIVYVGSLSIWKGTPVLVEAFRQLRNPDARLVLVGGWGSRGMRRYMEDALRSDPRISVRPGDPLPHLKSADLYVHPSYDDGFGLAAAEAVACGVPIIVTDQTGAKELLDESETGYIVPAGDVEALAARLSAFVQRVPDSSPPRAHR